MMAVGAGNVFKVKEQVRIQEMCTLREEGRRTQQDPEWHRVWHVGV